jgi:acyl-CoA thioester hydrolase
MQTDGQVYASHRWPVRVYYEDTDAGGVVYYANYLKFMERARTEWLRALGFEQDQLREESGALFVVREAALKFLRPARFNDELMVVSRVTALRRARIVFSQEVQLNTPEQPLLCSGQTTVVSVQAKTYRPRSIPESIVAELTGEC